MPRMSLKNKILDAAEAVVLENGAAHMSLDMVARKAGVSKGGLMYHFPSKIALLKDMVGRLLDKFYVDREKKFTGLKDSKGRLFKAEIMAALDPDEKRERMALSILAAAAQAPGLLDPVRKAHQDHLKRLMASGLPFEPLAIVSLASDGLMFLELLRITPFSAGQREKIIKGMIRQIEAMETGKESTC